MKRSTLAAVLGNIVSLFALWLVNYGVELSPEDQAQIVSAILLIVNTCALIIPAIRAALSRNAPQDTEAGRAQPWMLSVLAILSATVMALHLTACSIAPDAPRQAIAASYVTVESLAETAEIAHRDGHIDDQQRAVIKADLQTAMDALAEAREIEAAGGDAEGRLQYVRSILIAVQSLLPEVPAHE